MESNKDILNKAIGRPAMMGFMLLMGTYLVTGQLIPGSVSYTHLRAHETS